MDWLYLGLKSPLTDSLALAVGPGCILQGVGNKIKYYPLDLDRAGEYFYLESFDLNFEDKIHGIELAGNDCYFIYGGRYLAFCKIKSNDFQIIAHCKLADCISSAVSKSTYTSRTLYIVTTYNVAVEVTVDEKDTLEIRRKCVSERSTLYCSHMRGHEWTDLTIFGGTALGEILIWSPTNDGQSSISYRFSAPQGVIFSIWTNRDVSELYTTSDDRSVRFWKLTRNAEQTIEGHHLRLTCFGHTGRVFRSTLTNFEGVEYLITIGEDSRICCWDMYGKLMFRRDLQAGALWSITVGRDYPKRVFVTTGNGGLAVLKLAECLKEVQVKCIPSADFFNESYPAKVRFLSTTTIICLTNKDELHLIKTSTAGGDWSIIGSITLDFKSTVLEVFTNLIAIGGCGRIVVYKYNGEGVGLELLSQSSEIFVRAAHWIDERWLFVSDNNGVGRVMTSDSLKTIAQLSKTMWSTSVLLTDNRGHLVVADRQGNLHSFLWPHNSIEAPLHSTLKRVHGNLGVTEMRANDHGFTTTGHDGTIKIIERSCDGKLKIYNSKKVPIKWIERTIDGDLVLGFNDQYFTVYSQKERQILAEVDCGGGHRYWDFIRNGSDGQFLFINNRQLQLVNISVKSALEPVQNSVSHWHTNSTNCLRVDDGRGIFFLFSGGEEGLIKIHMFYKQDEYICYRDEISTHISNVRSIFIDGERLYSGGGRAQLCIHEFTRINSWGLQIRELGNFMLKSTDLARTRNGQSQRVDFDPETRFMCIHVHSRGTIIVGCSDGYIRVFIFKDKVEPERMLYRWEKPKDYTRIVDEIHNTELELLAETYYGKCILDISEMEIGSAIFVVTTGTDGKINFWRVEYSYDCSHVPHKEVVLLSHAASIPHHDSGINGFDWRAGDDGSVWIVTGGDDQRIVASKIQLDSESNKLIAISRIEFPYRHTAQVTGIKFINDKEFLSVGVDQQVLKHSVEQEEFCEKVKFTSVADAKGLALVGSSDIAVYGSGLDIISLKKEEI